VCASSSPFDESRIAASGRNTRSLYAECVQTAGKLLLVAAAVLAVLGFGALVLSRLGVDGLPGTLRWKSARGVTVVVPIGLMIVVSIVGTIVLNILFRR
jgi:DUF2905 family protein